MRVVSFSTYRTAKLLHGGQIRLNALHEAMRREGFSVRHVSVHTADEADPRHDEISVRLDSLMQLHLHERKLRPDVDVCTVFDRVPGSYHLIENKLNEFDPDLIWLEQPWLWPMVRRYLSDNGRAHLPVVYGSQNVETELIATLVPEWDADMRARRVQDVRLLEEELSRSAAGIVCVSASDRKHFEAYRKPILVAPNGVSLPPPPGGLEYWSNVYRNHSLALFVGSAHPPNLEGFVSMFGGDLSYLAPDEKIVVIGGVCDLLRATPTLRKQHGLMFPRLDLLDHQDAGGLATFFQISKVILLPIVSGGGTNLKTAEALYSRKPIIATSRAFQGYESYMGFPNVHISDDPREFRALLKRQLSALDRGNDWKEFQSSALDNLLWSRALADVGPWLRKLVAQAGKDTVREPRPGFKVRSDLTSVKSLTVEGVLLKPMLGDGWHTFEAQGTWSKCPIATLRIPNPFGTAPMKVTLDLEVMIARGESNILSIYTASARHITRRCWSNNRILTVSFAIPGGDATLGNAVELYVQTRKLLQPRFRSGAVDERALGCRIRKIVLEQVLQTSASRSMTRSFETINAIVGRHLRGSGRKKQNA